MSDELIDELKLIGPDEEITIRSDGKAIIVTRQENHRKCKHRVTIECMEQARLDMLSMALRRTRERLELGDG